MIQKIKISLLLAVTIFSFFTLLLPASIDAARKPSKTEADCASGRTMNNPAFKPDNEEPEKICEPLGNACAQDKNNPEKCLQDNVIVKNLNKIVAVLSGLVGVVVVGVIILGGIQYALAGDKAEAVSAAKQRIVKGLIALAAFLFLFAFLQWLIPGGVFK